MNENNENNENINEQNDTLMDFDFSKGEKISETTLDSQTNDTVVLNQETEVVVKKKHALPKIWIAALITVIIGSSVVFVFGNVILKNISPEKYLKTAILKTTENMKINNLGVIDMSKYKRTPLNQNLKVNINSVSEDFFGYNASLIKNATMDLSILSNPIAKEVLMKLGMGMAGFNLTNNELYISKDTLALRLPIFHVKLNPQTFVTDWNNSFYSEYAKISNNMGVQEFIDSLFIDTETIEGENSKKPSSDQFSLQKFNAENLIETLSQNFVFENKGSEEIEINGEYIKVDKMSYTLSAEDMTTIWSDYIDNISEIALEYIKTLPKESLEILNYQLKIILTPLKTIVFENELTLDFYINKDSLITKISSEDIGIKMYDEVLRFDFYIDFYGDDNLSNSFKTNLIVNDDYQEVGFSLKKEATNLKNAIDEKIVLEMVIDDEELFNLKYAFNWEKNSSEEDNMILSFNLDDTSYEDIIKFKLSGKLIDNQAETVFSDGYLTLNFLDDEIISLNLDYGIKQINDDEITIDKDDAVNFFDIEREELSNIFELLNSLY